MLIHVVCRSFSDVSHIPRSGIRTLAHTLRRAGADVVEDVGVAGELSDTVAECAEHLRGRWDEERPDVIHAVGIVGALAALAARPDGVPLVATFDERPAPAEVELRVARRVDAVMALSTAEQESWRQIGVRTVNPGSLSLLQPAVSAASDDGADVLCLSRGRDVETAVDSMPWWRGRLVLAGHLTEARWISVHRRAAELGVSDRIERRSGAGRPERTDLYRRSALLIAGTEAARHGADVLEAAAHAVPAVAVAAEAYLDHVVPGSTGVLLAPGTDARGLGRATAELLADPLRRRGMGAAALVRAHALHDRSAAGSRLLEVYRGLTREPEPETSPTRITQAGTDLALQYMPLARQLASRYAGRGQRFDDLLQVASLGLVRAATRFDPDLGHEFHSFAVPTILGELRRHFRDHAWAARVPRSVQELSLKVQRAADDLRAEWGRDATAAEIADELGLMEEEVLQAMQARGEAMTSKSLDHPMGDHGNEAFGDLVGDTDPALEYVELREAVRDGLTKLPAREREILLMRFYGEHTQSEIAQRLGLSQVHVSRLITRTLAALRDHVTHDQPLPHSWTAAPAAIGPRRSRSAA